MQITIQWFGQLRDAAGKAEEAAEVADGATIRDALGECARGRSDLEAMLFRDGAVAPTIIVSMNGTQVAEPGTTPAIAGATLLVMSPISGG